VNGVLAGELAAIRRRIPLPFGGSCLAVARAPTILRAPGPDPGRRR
jgi:hypothetical protein